jgi:hypothetical protein
MTSINNNEIATVAQAFLVIAVVCLPSAGGSAADAPANPAHLPLVTLTGADSHIGERSCHRVASQAEWIKIWQRHKVVKEAKNYDLYYNPLDLPYLNFEKCMVIAVFQGSGWNAAGWEALDVEEDTNSVTLRYRIKGYQTAGPGGGGKQVNVYGFFILPRSKKTVVLEEEVRTKKPEPPVREERARLPG